MKEHSLSIDSKARLRKPPAAPPAIFDFFFSCEEVKNGDLMSRCLIALRGPDRDGR